VQHAGQNNCGSSWLAVAYKVFSVMHFQRLIATINSAVYCSYASTRLPYFIICVKWSLCKMLTFHYGRRKARTATSHCQKPSACQHCWKTLLNITKHHTIGRATSAKLLLILFLFCLITGLPSVLWHCWLGRLTRKNSSPIWPIMCLVWR